VSTARRRLRLLSNLMSTVINPSSVLNDVFWICTKSSAVRRNSINNGQLRLTPLLKLSLLHSHILPHLNRYKGTICFIHLHQRSPTAQRRPSITLTPLRTTFLEPLFFPWKDISTIVWHGTMMKCAFFHCNFFSPMPLTLKV